MLVSIPRFPMLWMQWKHCILLWDACKLAWIYANYKSFLKFTIWQDVDLAVDSGSLKQYKSIKHIILPTISEFYCISQNIWNQFDTTV